jgi:hypothetical protein
MRILVTASARIKASRCGVGITPGPLGAPFSWPEMPPLYRRRRLPSASNPCSPPLFLNPHERRVGL